MPYAFVAVNVAISTVSWFSYSALEASIALLVNQVVLPPNRQIYFLHSIRSALLDSLPFLCPSRAPSSALPAPHSI